MAMSTWLPKAVVFDVDGVFTDGTFLYSSEGKAYKRFGPDDADAVKQLMTIVEVHAVSADYRGEAISRSRIERDIGIPLHLVSAHDRCAWIRERWDESTVVYMGDSYLDVPVFQAVGYAIAPANAAKVALSAASFVTERQGADRAVAEACQHILEMFDIQMGHEN
jgi:3-deoxy-D-manno-octulosonate 8-phosphate phosphatase (KDO 8-P phosphatase)